MEFNQNIQLTYVRPDTDIFIDDGNGNCILHSPKLYSELL
jgi:hypothetical protein